MLEQRQPQGIEKYIGKNAVAAGGENLGKIARFLPNRVTETPEWLVVEAGILRTHSYVVPLAGSSFEPEHVELAYPANVVTEGPEIEFDDALSPEAESMLSNYYGLGAS